MVDAGGKDGRRVLLAVSLLAADDSGSVAKVLLTHTHTAKCLLVCLSDQIHRLRVDGISLR